MIRASDESVGKGLWQLRTALPFLNQSLNKGGKWADRGKNDLAEPHRHGEYEVEIHHQPKADHEVN